MKDDSFLKTMNIILVGLGISSVILGVMLMALEKAFPAEGTFHWIFLSIAFGAVLFGVLVVWSVIVIYVKKRK